MKVGWVHVKGGEADTGDGERIAFAKAIREAGSFDGDATHAAGFFQADQRAGLFDDASEHAFILRGETKEVTSVSQLAGAMERARFNKRCQVTGCGCRRSAGDGAIVSSAHASLEALRPFAQHAE